MADNPLNEFDAPAAAPPRGGNPLDEFDAPKAGAEVSASGVGNQLVRGISHALVYGLTLPYRAIQEGGREALERRKAEGGSYLAVPPLPSLEEMSWYRPFLNQPEPQNMPERFARSVGETIGGAAIPEAGFLGKAEKLAATAPTTALRSTAKDIGTFFKEAPGKAVATDVAASTASGVGQQTAREADLGPGWEVAAGSAAPVAAIAPVAGAERLLRAGADVASPTMARWAANGKALLDRMAIRASADGSVPETNAGARAASDQIIANQLRRAGKSVDDIEKVLRDAADARRFNANSSAQDALGLVDVDPSMQRLAGSAVRASPEAGNRAVDFTYARQTGQTPPRGELPTDAGLPTRPMFAKPITGAQAEKKFGTDFGTPSDKPVPMGQFERVRDALKRALGIEDSDFHGHAANANRTDQAILKAAKDEAQPLYDAVYAAGRNPDGTEVNLNPVVRPILDKWKAAAGEEPGPVAAAINKGIRHFERALEPPSRGASNIGFGGGIGSDKSMIERLDKAKQFFDGEIEKFFDSPVGRNRYTGGVVTKFKNEVLDAIDAIKTNDLGAKYAEARGRFSSRMEAREALQMGRDAFKQDSDIGIDALRGLNGEGHQKLFRLGLLGTFEKQAGSAKRAADITQIFENPRIQELLGEAIPRSRGKGAEFVNRPERFGQYLGNEKMMIQTRNEVLGNSKTAQRMADDEAFDTLQSVVEQVRKTPSVQGLLMRVAEGALDKLFGYRADTAAEIARSLFTADPSMRAQVLSRVRERMGQDRFSYFSSLLREQAKQYAGVGAATAVQPTMAAHGTPDNPVSVQTPQEADRLPSGTHIITPDGRHKVVP